MINNINNYLQQHESIAEIAKLILNTTKLSDEKIINEAKNISLNINTLAGKLRVHLLSEDKFLYPELKNSNDENLKKIAIKFEDEMGHIAELFTKYKDNYKIYTKITENISEYKKDTNFIFDALFNRIEREEKELYIL